MASATDAEPAVAAPPARITAYAWYALFVLVLVYVVNFIDRQIISILAQDIKRDLHLENAQIGFLYGTAFAVFYALFGIPLGRLADSWYRGRLIALGLTLWSSMTMLSGFASSFAMLATARIGVGIGEASASPAAFSLISDQFPKEKRATALSIYSSGLYIGGALSLPIGGFVLSGWNHAFPDPATAPFGLVGWQAAFLAVGVPGLLLALWVTTLREPVRGGLDGHPEPVVRPNAWRDFGRELGAIVPPLTLLAAARESRLVANLVLLAVVLVAGLALVWLTGDRAQWLAYGLGAYAIGSWVQSLRLRDAPVYRLLWGEPSVMLLVVSFGSISFISYAVAFWAVPYALGTFYGGAAAAPSQIVRGLTAEQEVSMILGGAAAIAAAAGVILGGVMADAWRRRDARGRVFINMLAVVLPAPAVWIMFTTHDLGTFFLMSPVAQFFGSMWVGAAVATLQDLVLPRMRATAGATYVLGTTMVGLALGPYYAGKMADVLGSVSAGVFALYAVPPFTLLGLWFGSRRLAELEADKAERARAAGEAI